MALHILSTGPATSLPIKALRNPPDNLHNPPGSPLTNLSINLSTGQADLASSRPRIRVTRHNWGSNNRSSGYNRLPSSNSSRHNRLPSSLTRGPAASRSRIGSN
jgi:hypothetical protein